MARPNGIINFTLVKEGGLSSHQGDSARHNPSPCGNGKNGYPYHTNKGVQWITFKSLAPQCGYAATCANFLKMPMSIWLKIYEIGYWNPMQANRLKNEAIANTIVSWAWGSGVGGATASLDKFFKEHYNKDFTGIGQMVDFMNDLSDRDLNRRLFDQLTAHRKKFLLAIPGSVNDAGWLSRETAFYILNLPYTFSSATKKALTYGIISIAIGAAIIGYGKYQERKAA